MRLLALLVLLLPLAAAAPATRVSEADAIRIGWPRLTGPLANFDSLRTGIPLVQDLSQARLAWISQSNDFGDAKTGSRSYRNPDDFNGRLGTDPRGKHPGNWAGPIVADGRVYASSFRPAGPAFKSTCDGQPVEYRLDADDLAVAIDFNTGKTLWTAIEPGGISLSGGKRGGFQVAPVFHNGVLYTMGSTGRLFAYDAATGKRLWAADFGPAHAAAVKAREKALAELAAGTLVAPDGPEWFCSLLVAQNVLIAADNAGSPNVGLRGYDLATGKLLWQLKSVLSKYSTPTIWTHAGKEFLLAATTTGQLSLIDPVAGKPLWTLRGLGANHHTLTASESHVLLNVAAPADPKAKRTPGSYGAVRLALDKGEVAWQLPSDPAYQIPTWFDNTARMRAIARDGRFHTFTEGTKDAPGLFLVIQADTGKILARHVNTGSAQLEGLFYFAEDRLLARADSVHGPTRGGRHPFLAWSIDGDKIAPYTDGPGHPGMDLVDFTNAYEVLMEAPLVAGRVFERTLDGRIACYDLRATPGVRTIRLTLAGAPAGLPGMPLVLAAAPDGAILSARAFPPSDRETALPWGTARRHAAWERAPAVAGSVDASKLAATIDLPFGTHAWKTTLTLDRNADQFAGTWTRDIPALDAPYNTAGPVTGRGPDPTRLFPTPWLKDSPWTSFGKSPEGAASYVVSLADVVKKGNVPRSITLCFDYDPATKSFPRAVAAAFSVSQAWHEVDLSACKLDGNRLTGNAVIILNSDWWTQLNPTAAGIALLVTLDVTFDGEKTTGTHTTRVGVAHTLRGSVKGALSPDR